jgi:hypothetical protein
MFKLWSTSIRKRLSGSEKKTSGYGGEGSERTEKSRQPLTFEEAMREFREAWEIFKKEVYLSAIEFVAEAVERAKKDRERGS